MSDKKQKFFKKIEVKDSDEKGDEKDAKTSFPKKEKSEEKDKKELDEGKNDRCWNGYKPAKGKSLILVEVVSKNQLLYGIAGNNFVSQAKAALVNAKVVKKEIAKTVLV